MRPTGNTCRGALNGRVPQGEYFTPIGQDICKKCKCVAGQAVGCFNQTCSKLPDCDKYQNVDGKCCEFECLEDDGLSNKAELTVILSLSIGLVLLLIILITILYLRRQSLKKNQEQKTETKTQSTSSATEQVQPSSTTDSIEQHPTNSHASSEMSHPEPHRESATIELPPPYYPPGNLVNVNKDRSRQALPPNEPPPPYDREESAV